MLLKNIKNLYEDIFMSYNTPALKKHIEKIKELDAFLPHTSTFFCITNTQELGFEYISKNMFSCLAIEPEKFKQDAMHYFWSRIHPDDVEHWLKALNSLMDYTLNEIDEQERYKMSYTWNYRFKNGHGKYVNIVQNTTPLEFDAFMKPIIGLAHYTVLDPNIKLDVTATAKYLSDNGEYETRYFNCFNKKLLDNEITNRERDIVRLLVLNYSSKEIAERLNISSNTVDTHRRNILKKLNINSTGELIGMLKINQNLL
ncbi:response regulator transcription factor [Mangrovimonas cancribranchiae]|uniref:LuxR C-terminal-related transcriptional regulator n=2 Tax=Mangrovimonas cancribranchiae TaxID=3080055 RepID=A0AAU6P2Q0_9FLAO